MLGVRLWRERTLLWLSNSNDLVVCCNQLGSKWSLEFNINVLII